MDNDFLLAEIAKLHYIDGMKQKDISTIFAITPIQVSRLLRLAVEREIVQFHINMPVPLDFKLGKALKDRYGLSECAVIRETDEEAAPMRIAQYLSQFVHSILQGDSVLGLSWGRGIYETAKLFPYSQLGRVRVVQLAGGVFSGHPHLATPSQIIISACERLGSIPVLLNAPFFTTNIDTKSQLMLDGGIRQVFDLARQATVNIIGASPLRADNTMSQVGMITGEDIEELRAAGAVGDVAGYFIDENGSQIQWSKSQLYTGIPLEEIGRATLAICIAGELEKEGVIRASLRHRYYNMLVTSAGMAERLLQ